MTRRRAAGPTLTDMVYDGTVAPPKKPSQRRQPALPARPLRGEELQVLERHLRWMRTANLSDRYIQDRRYAMQRLRRDLGKRLLSATREDLLRWQEQLTGGPGNWHASTNHARSFYRWAHVTEELIDRDPSVALAKVRLRRGLPRPIAEEDLTRALENTTDRRVRLALALAGWAGLRACEIAGLTRADVVDNVAEPYLVVFGKGRKERIVPIGPGLLAELRAYGMPLRGPIVKQLDGQRVKPSYMSHMVNNYLHGLGIASTLHSLRHRFGTQVYSRSRDLRATQEVMGHASPAMTALYTAVSSAAARPAIVEMDAELDGGQ